MTYKVVPFSAKITRDDSTASVANQIQTIVDNMNNSGWDYMRMETVQTWVAGTNGCFGIGAQPGFNTMFNVLIFQKG